MTSARPQLGVRPEVRAALIGAPVEVPVVTYVRRVSTHAHLRSAQTPALGTEPEWLSTHEAARWLGCSPQTVRDRCARGGLPFETDPDTGHRRVNGAAVRALAPLAAQVAKSSLEAKRPRKSSGRRGFHASVLADVEGVLNEHLVADIVDQVVAEVADLLDKRESAESAAYELIQLRAALSAVERAPWWRRGRMLRQLRSDSTM